MSVDCTAYCTLYVSGDGCICCLLSLSIQDHYSPLMVACLQGHEDVVKELIGEGTNLDIRNTVGYHGVT